MIVKSATGPVDLSQPENIRKGMVWEAFGERFTITSPLENATGHWQTTTTASVIATSMRDFLGCDPEHATRADCERFGLAPSADAGAHGFARTREGFAVDLRRCEIAGLVVRSEGHRKVFQDPAIVYDAERFIGLDSRHASAEDVERLCCGEKRRSKDIAAPRLCSLAIGDHDEHEDIAAGVKWKAKVAPPDASKWTPVFHDGPPTTGSLSFTVNGKTEMVRYERETYVTAEEFAAWRRRATTPGTAENIALETMAKYAVDTAGTWAAAINYEVTGPAARETTMKLRHGEAADKGDHFWYSGSCGAAVTSETLPEIVRLATERGKPVKADVNGVAVTAHPGCHVEGLAKAWLAALNGKGDVVADTWWTSVNFLCPECAGINQWGSSRQADGTFRRSCHGHLVQPDGSGKLCRFSWTESDDARWLKDRKTEARPAAAMSLPGVDTKALHRWTFGTAPASTILSVNVGAMKPGSAIVLRVPGGPTVNLAPLAAALRASLATLDALSWSAADKRSLRDAAHAVCEVVEATDGKAPSALAGPVREALAALAAASHVGPAVIGEAERARDAARAAMGRRK